MRNIAIFILSALLLNACCYPQQGDGHPYGVNYNFEFWGDSLILQSDQPTHNQPISAVLDSSNVVYHGDPLVVAQIMVIPEDSLDSVWVKVARDQLTMGWTHESDLIANAVPSDPISQFIYLFSQRHFWYFMVFLICLLLFMVIQRVRRRHYHIVHFRDIATCYPTLLTLTLSSSAVLYASIQKFVPETWVHFYYHPTLNPFELPFILALFLSSIWLIIILLVATLEEVSRQLRFSEAIIYLLSLFGVCVLCYMVFSILTLYWVGYLLFFLYIAWALWRYFCYFRPRYICGKCGSKLHDLGRCPRCGAMNE